MNKPINWKVRELNLDSMIRSNEYDSFIGDKLGNSLFINDADRADRLYKYAEEGCDGSTHSEIIEDWREFLDLLRLPEQVRGKIEGEILACEDWHYKNGSLHEVIG